MAGTNLHLYEGEFGKVFRIYTRCDDMPTATQITLKFKNTAGTTASLNASYVVGDTTNYAVDATVSSGWSTGKAGKWTGTVEALWGASGKAIGSEFFLTVEASSAI